MTYKVDVLSKWIESEKIPHALLFAGALIESKALAFAKQVIGSNEEIHPDLYQYWPEGKLGLHSMEALRSLQAEVYLPPFQAKKKVFILYSAERMLPVSGNAILKTLEEPPETSLLILVTPQPERLLSTIRSRCQIIHFPEEEQSFDEYIPFLETLLNAPSSAYIIEGAGSLAAFIESRCEIALEEGQKDETAFQKEQREKAHEGKIALKLHEEAEVLWIAVLNRTKNLYDLDKVNFAVNLAKKYIQRSMPLKNVLETFFLRLNEAKCKGF